MAIELFDFQKEDIDKLKQQKFGAIASEMGTGKTHEAIQLIMEWLNFHNDMPTLDKRKPALVVAPLNTHKSWLEKFELQAPHLRIFRIDRKDRDDLVMSMLTEDADVYLMHWQALVKLPVLEKFKFSVIVGDEVHRISNREAKTTVAFKKLQADYKLGMSGTMSGDKPDKLWSVLNWLDPQTYAAYWQFRDDFILEANYSGYRQVIGVKNTEYLSRDLAPFFVRHLKKDRCCDRHPNGVMDFLPDKTYDKVFVQLGAKQRRIYDEMEREMTAWLGDNAEDAFTASVVIAQLTRLSQMALATPNLQQKITKRENPMYELDPDNEPEFIEDIGISVVLEAPSSKIDAVQEIIEDHDDKPFVVFSSSKQAINLAKKQLSAAGITCEVLSGDTPQHRRDWMIDAFQRGEFRVFLGVIAACGEGVDGLQNVCDTVIFMDRSWTSYENKQAEDRLHRGGQKNSVNVIDIVAEDTVDEYRHSRIAQKWAWLRSIVGDGEEISGYKAIDTMKFEKSVA